MADRSELRILFIVLAGSSDEFPRFTILDAKDRPWNGQEYWPTGVHYAKHNDAAIETLNMLRSHFDGDPQRYVNADLEDTEAARPANRGEAMVKAVLSFEENSHTHHP